MTETKKYRLIGIDPGTNVLGYGIVEVENRQLSLVALGVITMQHLEEQQHKLKKIFEGVQSLIKQYAPQEMAIEAPFYAKNVQSMLKLGRAQGVSIAAAITMGVEITEYSPKKIKQSVTGNGNAAKEQVAAMLETIFKQKIEEKYLDATDALATAVCHFYQSKSVLGGGKKVKDWAAFVKENPQKKV
ncbi:MAG: crossover junction endodeoxyribonuclease RuvC [Saprospiraceae bacterium]|jgi:crossover junction endodeoxyribonuclease RuvC|nr:crossover junction endodeoxyribonuclease RuvC [Saprospiraceae bacterium]